jgi:hypothetical protein
VQLHQALRFTEGAPDVTGLPCDEITDSEAGAYMRRHHLQFGPDGAVRFHHILQSDPGEDLHDHPWDFVSLMLAGSYTEHTPAGVTVYTAPCVITRKAEQLHRLELDQPVWTYIVTGKVRRRWGFCTSHGWVPHTRYTGTALQLDCAADTTGRW